MKTSGWEAVAFLATGGVMDFISHASYNRRENPRIVSDIPKVSYVACVL